MRAREIGDIGEKIAINHLLNQRVRLVRFGKEMHKRKATDDLPSVPDLELGYSHGNFHTFTVSGCTLDWQDSNIPHWADIPYETIKSCAEICKKHSSCSIRDENPTNAPCFNTSQLLEEKWLSSITPAFTSIVGDANGNPIPLKGHRVVFKCIQKILPIALGQHLLKPITPENNFILNNMLVTLYIQNYWQTWSSNNPQPYLDEIEDAIRNGNKEQAEVFMNANRAAAKRFPGHNSHPGRYDFIGIKDGNCCAIEVKVNTSKLTYWQKVRLGCLKMMGHNIKILQISIDRKNLDALNSKPINEAQYSITESETVDTTDVEMPTLEELVELANLHYLKEKQASLTAHYKKLLSSTPIQPDR